MSSDVYVIGLSAGEIASLPWDSDFANPTGSAQQLIDVLTLMVSRDEKSADRIANNFLQEVVRCVSFVCPVCRTRRPLQYAVEVKALYQGYIGKQTVCCDCEAKSR
jgi:hypothetical protein